MNEKIVAEMERLLAEHYREPVRPVSQYCDAFYAWRDALRDRQVRTTLGQCCPDFSLESALDSLNNLIIPISKSSMLDRLIYGGEKLRTKQCPIHKGTWSGLEFVGDEACPHGCQLTGWIPEE